MLGATLLASCTVTSGPNLEVAAPGYAGGTPSLAGVLTQAEAELSANAAAGEAPEGGASGSPQIAQGDSDPQADAEAQPLPDQVASLPERKPGDQSVAAGTAPAADEKPVEVALAAVPAPEPVAGAAQPEASAAAAEIKPTAFIENGPGPSPAPQEKKRGFFNSLFASQPAAAETPSPIVELKQRPTAEAKKPLATEKPIISLASTGGTAEAARPVFSGDALPGVRQDSLFEITRKSGMDDISDIDLHEEDGPIQIASAAGLARLAPNGLIKQTEGVDVGCLKPSLVRVLKSVEQHFGKRMIVTSGYRSPERNRRARGAKNSLHMYCAAADVQVPGVSKWELAKFVRSMPGRGGVGTYCHTNSVHVDVGPERDWNWRCRRRG
ncbi:D-Ala-D-Ala carboxypeptidase family metallohydrolase [Aquibium sp. LZ166]|uniref:Murein endopeptidase K n=1 Tax=Aquibium pacificus TaxID=3153579 RepID=A0ABV3SRN0_9HYPH